jgi:RNA polymerase sigma-70 factor (ECF subfamily)
MAEERCAEALRLVTLLCDHPVTAGGETHALAALICFHHARAPARTGATGDVVLLAEQDRSRWDATLLARGFVHLRCAMQAQELTALHLEAGIVAVHASAPSFAQTDWAALVHYYEALIELKPTPVVKLNAAIAQACAQGPAAGLAQLDELAGNARMSRYAPYHAARGDLLLKLERRAEAAEALHQALECQLNGAERGYLVRKLRACAQPARLLHS